MNRIEELRRVRQDIERLRDEEKSLSTPIFNNMGVIRNLYLSVCKMSASGRRPVGFGKQKEVPFCRSLYLLTGNACR